MLAVKPQNFPEALKPLRPAVTKKKVFISIAAGVKTELIEKLLTKSPRVLRVMPNVTRWSVKAPRPWRAAGLHRRKTPDYTLAIFNAVGLAVEVEEKLMDAGDGLKRQRPGVLLHDD